MEMEQDKLNGQTKQEMEKSSLKNSFLERQLTKNRASRKELESSLKNREIEVNDLKIKMMELNKKYNLLKQLNKSTSVNSRSLESEYASLKKVQETENQKYIKIKNAFESVAIEIYSENKNQQKIKEIIGNFFDVQTLNVRCEDQLSVDSDFEEQFDINKNLEELEVEFNANKFEFDQEDIKNMENEINQISDLKEEEFEQMVFESKTMNNSKDLRENLCLKSSLKMIKGINELFDHESTSNKSTRHKLNKINLKNEIAKKLEEKIKVLSHKSKNASLIKSGGNSYFPSSINYESDIVFKFEDSKTKIFNEIKNKNFNVLTDEEQTTLKTKWNQVDSISEYTVEIIKFFKEKLTEFNLKIKSNLTEKSKY
jgi:hypothetical protein